MTSIDSLIKRIQTHRAYKHPIWKHWATVRPSGAVLGTLFHQIQKFCASTRPGLSFPRGLRALGLVRQSELVEEIVASEAGHGADLALMAGFLVNKSAAPKRVFADIENQTDVEAGLKGLSDAILGSLPGYDRVSGLLPQTTAAIAVFSRRAASDAQSTLCNLGTALALEIISNQSLIPGEKEALVDCGAYGVDLADREMHYLADHWGEAGAEHLHERNVISAVESALNGQNAALIEEGVDDFLDALDQFWDVLDSALLQSGIVVAAVDANAIHIRPAA